jgi:RHS repeat-associated protein
VLVVRSLGVGGTIQSTTPKYQMLDHQDSPLASYDSAGTPLERASYDAWGERRDHLTLVALPHYNPGFATQFARGNTGHEHAFPFGLIHMNGRVYDAKLARFLQADPFVQSPGNVQSYNRYSYVLNNPLVLSDPSGYFSIKDEFKKWAGPIVAVVGTAICGGNPQCGAWGYAAVGAAAGVAGAAVNGGDILKSALIGGISGAAFYQVGVYDFSGFRGAEQIVRAGAFGAVGRITSQLSGGNFGHGFVSAGVGGMVSGSSLARPGVNAQQLVGRSVAKVLIAGTVSEVTGGKFANGASTVAFTSILRAIPDVYEKFVGYELDIRPGEGVVQKMDDTMPQRGRINFGIQGRPITDPCLLCENGPVAHVANRVWGIDAVSGLHDVMQISMDSIYRDIFNVLLMPLAAAVTYTGFIGQALNSMPAHLPIPVRANREREDGSTMWIPSGAF